MWEKEKEKVISLIYLWWNEGMLNASEHAAVVILSGKMKCLHSRLSEEQGNERGGDRKLEGERESGGWVYCRRVLTISSLPHHRTRHKMATSLLLTTSIEWGGGHLNHRYLISHLCSLFFNLNYFSYLWTRFMHHSAERLFYLHGFTKLN